MQEVRTYHSFRIVWDDRAEWTGYDTAEQAQAVIDGASRNGTVVEKRWTVAVNPAIAKPGLTPAQIARPLVGGGVR
jgi:hypothetical protein